MKSNTEEGQKFINFVIQAVKEENQIELREKIAKHEQTLYMVLEQLDEAKTDIVNAISDMSAKEIADGGIDSYVEEIRFYQRKAEICRVKIETLIEIIGSDKE